MTQTVVDNQTSKSTSPIQIDGKAEGLLAVETQSIGCSNPDCLKTTVSVRIGKYTLGDNSGYRLTGSNIVYDQRLLPQGAAVPQPHYIPKALRDDYYEACLIRELSPKAAATLIRRCLQGMIRDFAGIKRGRLIDEIKALRSAVDDGSADRAVTPETVEAIDHVRGIGNIDADMEKDIDLIIDVDPGEAQALIELVEMLFEEWYVAREARRRKFERISNIAKDKEAKKTARTAQPNALEGRTPPTEGDEPDSLNALLGVAQALGTTDDQASR